MTYRFIPTAILLTAGIALTLGGCTPKPATEEGFAEEKVNVDLVAPPGPVDAANAKPPADAPSGAPQLAYDYAYGFSASAKGIETLITADQAACAKAGPGVCQVISLSANNNPDSSYVRKTLELRVTPQWLTAWQGNLDSGLRKVGGHLTSQNVTSEDLSLQIVDTDAHLKNKLALRDRLLTIIQSHPGKVADLVEAETQLSQVQSEIDSAQSSLAVLRKRVATTHLTLTYESEAAAASNGTFRPVTNALRNILNNMMQMVGALITIAAFLLPLAVVLTPAIWLFSRWWKNRKSRPKPES
ncbi:MAG: DUF4349 domain-containing protein [Asticcacaulis sp.]|uniref:DUF4349 domain-containing protein n=1 Tax=Asticcacaulis sp. TaxID=1872648 RepID=UPI0039E379DF